MDEIRTVALRSSWQEGDQAASTVDVKCVGDIGWCMQQLERLVDKHRVAASVKVKAPQKDEQFPPRNGKGRAEVPVST
jgi:hypothetical protein